MKKATRKLTSLLLAMIMLFGALPTDALAEALEDPAPPALAEALKPDDGDAHADPETILSERAETEVGEREPFELDDDDADPGDAPLPEDDLTAPAGETVHILGEEPFSIHVAPLARSVFAGDALSFALSWEGDSLPKEIRVTVTQDGEGLYAADALTDTVTVVPADTGDASTVTMDVAMIDDDGYTTHASAAVPCAVRDAERPAQWEDELRRAFAATGEWPRDVVALAETQLGWRESDRDFTVDEAGEKQGFTRFGAWNGSAYGDWNAAFTAFCLRYAGVSSGAFPAKNEAWSWLEALSARGLYADRGPVQPAPGDLLFADTDGDGIADRVGIVAKVGSGITAIEGDVRGEAAFVNYGGDDDRVLGFGLLNAAWANHAGVKTEAKEEIKEESSTASPGSSAPARNTPCPRAA